MNTDYNLNFTIPQGPTGPTGAKGETGPTGPTGTANASVIGYAFQPRSGNLNFIANNVPVIIDILQGNLGLNVEYGEDGELIFLEDGCYKIEYRIILQIFDASPQNNYLVQATNILNKNLNNTTGSVTLSIDNDSSYYYFSNSYIRNVNAGDSFSLAVSCEKEGNFYYYAPYIMAYKLSDKIGNV